MKTKTKIIGWILLGFTVLGGLGAALGIWFYNGYIDWRGNFPSRLEAGAMIHGAERMHSMGPSGLNHAFLVYDLPEHVAAKIEAEGPSFLETSPMTVAQRMRSRPAQNPALSWEPFDEWAATPVPAEDRWLRARIRGSREFDQPWEPSLGYFFDERLNQDFLDTIAPDVATAFHEAIRTPGSFYAYGAIRGGCVLLVSPAQDRIYFLRR